jgi:hypothetical protein
MTAAREKFAPTSGAPKRPTEKALFMMDYEFWLIGVSL